MKRSKSETLGSLFSLTVSLSADMPPDKSIALWRSMADRFPKSPQFARRLLHEMMAGEDWQGLDALRMDGRWSDDPDSQLLLIDHELARRRFSDAEQRISEFVERFGSTLQLKLRQYELLFCQRSFSRATQIARLIEETSDYRQISTRTRFYKGLWKQWKDRAPQPDYLTVVINLDESAERLSLLRQQLTSANRRFERVPGVKGAYLPDFVTSQATHGRGASRKGAVGCFLSHVSAWEAIIRSGFDFGLVLEDDATLLAPLPPMIRSLNLPHEVDICFINERASCPDTHYDKLKAVSLSRSAFLKPESWTSLGTDGYIITKQACIKLIRRLQSDGIAGDIDWRLLSYSLTASEKRAFSRHKSPVVRNALSFHAKSSRQQARFLRSFCLQPPLTRQNNGGSIRFWDDRAGLGGNTDLKERVLERYLSHRMHQSFT